MENIRIDNINTLIEYMKSGINMFVGAGFSLYARDENGKSLPKGTDLLKELKDEFGDNGLTDLSMFCTVMEKTNKTALHDFLTHRFTVKNFDNCYYNLNLINIRNIYTTNIDNLIPQIIAKNESKYINNQQVNGDCANDRGINYLPLHGNVEMSEDEYVFGVAAIANTYNLNQRSWNYLSAAIEKYPTIFIGYSMNDSSTIQALTSRQTLSNAQKDIWIVLHEASDPAINYFTALGFNIIIADTKDFLKHIPNLIGDGNDNVEKTSCIEKLLTNNIIPNDGRNLVTRPIEVFFRGMPPIWTDIQRNIIYKTSYFKVIQDSVFNKRKNTIIIGAPVSGKTTLAMQIGYLINFDGAKIMLQDINYSRVEYIAKIVGNEKALIIIENFTDDAEAFLLLSKLPNTKVIGVDRTHNFGIVNHLISTDDFDIINVTELSEGDVQGVLSSLPVNIKKDKIIQNKNKVDALSLYEFVIKHIKGEDVRKRYHDFIRRLEKENYCLAQFLVLCAYMHYSRVPLSMEVAYRFFSEMNYKDVLDMQTQLSDLLKEDQNDELAQNNIDGYRPRSSYISEAIIRYASSKTLKDVLQRVISEIPHILICNYKTFRKWGFDKEIVLRAFKNWKEGMEFYENAFFYDKKNPYVLQQGALYLSANHQYNEAFNWIDRAQNMTNNRHFSIRNSHAIILFDANYDINSEDALYQLDKSMSILHQCYTDDKRGTFHATTYANQAIKYYNKYGNEKSMEYLRQASKWLKEEQESKPWHYELKALRKRLDEILNS